MRVALNRYFTLWAFVLPITSVVVIPSVPGTTPGLTMGVASVVFVFMLLNLPNYRLTEERREYGKFFVDIATFSLVLVGFLAISQLSLSLAVDDGFQAAWDKVQLVSSESIQHNLFRSSMVTQSFYLLSAVLLALFVKHFYAPSWNKYILYGGLALALYGYYEFLYFQLYHANGDFLTNRVFLSGEDQTVHSGSLFQRMKVFGIEFMRIKSLTGEPSMYSFTMLPIWIYAVHLKKTKLQLLMLGSLVLTFSTTAFVGIMLYFFLRIVFFKLKDRYLLTVLFLFFIAAPLLYRDLASLFDTVIGSKSQTYSGIERQSLMENHLDFFRELPLMNKLFGVGFGYVRSADLLSTFLCNIGLAGTALFTLLFLVPIIKIDNDYESIGVKCALIVIYATAMISVPEFAYLTIWLFIGIAYAKLRRNDRIRLSD